MKCDKHTMLLYAVTDRAWTGRETLRVSSTVTTLL